MIVLTRSPQHGLKNLLLAQPLRRTDVTVHWSVLLAAVRKCWMPDIHVHAKLPHATCFEVRGKMRWLCVESLYPKLWLTDLSNFLFLYCLWFWLEFSWASCFLLQAWIMQTLVGYVLFQRCCSHLFLHGADAACFCFLIQCYDSQTCTYLIQFDANLDNYELSPILKVICWFAYAFYLPGASASQMKHRTHNLAMKTLLQVLVVKSSFTSAQLCNHVHWTLDVHEPGKGNDMQCKINLITAAWGNRQAFSVLVNYCITNFSLYDEQIYSARCMSEVNLLMHEPRYTYEERPGLRGRVTCMLRADHSFTSRVQPVSSGAARCMSAFARGDRSLDSGHGGDSRCTWSRIKRVTGSSVTKSMLLILVLANSQSVVTKTVYLTLSMTEKPLTSLVDNYDAHLVLSESSKLRYSRLLVGSSFCIFEEFRPASSALLLVSEGFGC